jgi:hypothetical protein
MIFKAAATGQPEHDAVNAEGAGARRIREQQMERGEHLRHHQRRGRALRQPRQDQLRSGLRQPAPQRSDGEAEYTCDEYVLRTVDVAKPSAGDDQRRIGDQIDRDHSLDLRGAGAQLGGNGRDRDVDDESVDAEHELR